MMNLTPRANASHQASRFVGMPWSETFNCWHLVQAVQAEVFGRKLPDVSIGSTDDKTAALLAATAGWTRLNAPPRDGDVLTMIGADGPHVATMVAGLVLHNLGGKRADGSVWGQVKASDLHELGMLGFGHVKVWRAS